MKGKSVRVTLELPSKFVSLLKAKAELMGWERQFKGQENPPELDSGAIVAFLVLLEAMGASEAQIHASTPIMWRTGGPELVHEERRVFEDGVQIGLEKSRGARS